jgi:hypothetical protein
MNTFDKRDLEMIFQIYKNKQSDFQYLEENGEVKKFFFVLF